MWKRRKKNSAVTLIELLVALSVAGIISLAVMAVLGSGLKTYERIQSYGNVQTEVLLALEVMEKNIRNTFYFSGINFIGTSQSIEFAGIVESVNEEGNVKEGVGKISYYFDKSLGNLVAENRGYALATSEEFVVADSSETLAFIESFKLTYYYLNPETEKYGWKDSWDDKEEMIPKGVKMEVGFKDGQENVEVERIILIPAAG